ncbi:hypothetical protein D5086_031446 [Populus alba]|uniref:Uncharacterized protein n=1 Tax=Populus alba TaxID=43335 RepID=A0ACC4AIN7_POPAL
MATPISISLLNVFLLLFSLEKGYAVEENEATKSYLHVVKVNSLLPTTACNHSSSKEGAKVRSEQVYFIQEHFVFLGVVQVSRVRVLTIRYRLNLCSFYYAEGRRQSCSSSTCRYKVQYGDGSYSIGFFAAETLTLSSSNVFENFLFGCGQQNDGLFGQAAGLLGLGRSKLALPSQTAKEYKKLFAYCLPASSSSKGYLSLGGEVSKSVKFTPLSADFDSTPFYGLDITGLSVGGRKLSIDESAFSAGTVIDSGTVITRLPSTAYSELSSAFQNLMTAYPSTSGYSIFDTCYDFSKYDTVRIPKVGVTFKGGVEMDIDVSGILYPVNGLKRVCLAFAGNDDISVFGNVQQRTYQVVYDGAKGRVGFAPGGCS